MTRYLLAMLILLAGMTSALTGCATFTLRQAPQAAPPPSAVAPEHDGRSIAQLRSDNAKLRAEMDRLERDNRKWESAVKSRERDKDKLEDELKQAKKDRDYYKDRARGED